jgi:hypothetical protein
LRAWESDIKYLADSQKLKLIVIPGNVKNRSMAELAERMDKPIAEDHGPKTVVIDYGDLLQPIREMKGENDYNTQGQVFREMAEFATKHKVAVWTATQARRPTTKKKVRLTQVDSADSFDKPRIFDFLITLIDDEHYNENKIVHWHLDLMRDGEGDVDVWLMMDWANMRIMPGDDPEPTSTY